MIQNLSLILERRARFHLHHKQYLEWKIDHSKMKELESKEVTPLSQMYTQIIRGGIAPIKYLS